MMVVKLIISWTIGQKKLNICERVNNLNRGELYQVTSGRTITEDENFLKIKEFREQSKGKAKSGINRKNNSTKRKGKIVNQNIKKQKLKDSKLTQKIIDDERPSTSGLIFEAQGPLVVEDSFELTDSEDDTDNIPCCMCNQRYPPTLIHAAWNVISVILRISQFNTVLNNKGNNTITELRTILQRESQNRQNQSTSGKLCKP